MGGGIILQIISQKFFKTTYGDDIYITPYTYVVYSNILITENINTSIFSVEPIDMYKTINTYLVKFENKLEKQKGSPAQIVSMGKDEIINDIIACMSLFFMGVFTTDKNYLHNLIINIGNEKDTRESSQKLVPYIFDKNKFESINEENIDEFIKFIDKIILLKRSDYKKVIEVIRQFYKVLLLINVNIDLAYSTLVAGIESLASEFDNYETHWQDIDGNLRKDIEDILEEIEAEKSILIKQAIIKNTHSKLKHRYCKYCENIIDDDYFTEYIINKSNSAKKSDLICAIKNSYDTRSKYVHTFKKIGIEITIFAYREICYINRKPHITLNGLVRLSRYIILKTIYSLEDIETEKIDYFKELPGCIDLTLDNMDPNMWLYNEKNYNLDTSLKYLNGLVSHICSFWMGYDKGILPLKSVCDKIEILLKGLNGNMDKRKNLIMFYLIYNKLLNIYGEEYTSDNYENIIKNNKEIIDDLDLKNLVYYLLFKDVKDISVEEKEKIYNIYIGDKYKKNKIELPTMLENDILVDILNDCVYKNNDIKYEQYLRKLIEENPGSEYLINILKTYYKNKKLYKVEEIYCIHDCNYSKKKWIVYLMNLAKENNDFERYENYIKEMAGLNKKNENFKKIFAEFKKNKKMILIEDIHMYII